MEPTQMPDNTGLSSEEASHADEKACGERISYWLKKYGCDLQPSCVIRGGQVQMRIDIVKIPPEVMKQLKKAEKNGQPGPGFVQTGA